MRVREPYYLVTLFRTIMSRGWIFSIFILVDLAIVAAVVWCPFHHVPVSTYFFPAILLFIANGLWLVVMMVRKTPPGPS